MKAANRLSQTMIPVEMKTLRQLIHHRAQCEEVKIGKVARLIGAVILVTKIAPANNGQGAIGDPQLVVHAPVLTCGLWYRSQHPARHRATTHTERIVDTYLNIGMTVERCQSAALTHGADIINQQAHFNTALGGSQ